MRVYNAGLNVIVEELMKKSFVFAALVLAAAAAQNAHAAYTVTFSQVGANVVARGSGSIDTSQLIFETTGTLSPFVLPGDGEEITGAAASPIAAFAALIFPFTPFGFGGGAPATSGTGDIVAIDVSDEVIGVPIDYESLAPLSDTATYDGQTLASLGLNPGTYVYDIVTPDYTDTFTVKVVIPEASTWVMLLVGFGAIALIAHWCAFAPCAVFAPLGETRRAPARRKGFYPRRG
jgi:hypothetical protein